MTIAAYLGTFDPITNGHLDIITRACHLFPQVIVGVGQKSRKKLCFNPKERIEMISNSTSELENLSITSFDGLAVEFAKTHRVNVLIRGLRTEADFVYEMQMAMMNKALYNKIEIVFIPTRQDLSHVSSSLVKEVASLGGDINKFVPHPVHLKLNIKYKNMQSN